MKKKILILLIVFLFLAIGGVGYFLLSRNQPNKSSEEIGILEEEVIQLDPKEVGLEMIARSDSRAIKLILNNASDIRTIEFDLAYEADVSTGDKESGGRVIRNVTDELEVDGKSPFETKFYDLGSCSSGRCRYDTGVTEVRVVMKVVKMDGRIYQVEDSLGL